MEWQVVLDGRRGLNWLNLQGSADVRQSAGAERQRLRVVCLPSLVFGTKIKSPRVLQVWRKDHGLVSCFPWQLHAQIPRVQGHEGEFVVVWKEVFLCE